jgi:hypothetical protein
MTVITVGCLPASFRKAAFICVNIDTRYQLNLGKGSLNGAVSFAKLQRRQDLKSFSDIIRAVGRF